MIHQNFIKPMNCETKGTQDTEATEIVSFFDPRIDAQLSKLYYSSFPSRLKENVTPPYEISWVRTINERLTSILIFILLDRTLSLATDF